MAPLSLSAALSSYGMFLVILTGIVLQVPCSVLALQADSEVASDGHIRDRLLHIVSPANRQEFETSNVHINFRLRQEVPSGEPRVCWKWILDYDCYGFTADGAQAHHARKQLALPLRQQPYNGCSRRPFNGIVHLAASCWVLQFDLIIGGVVETDLRSINVITVDEMVNENYPDITRRANGEIGVLRYAVSNKGIGMIMEFGLGLTTRHLSNQKAEIVHSFDSLLGLPEKWREGFDKGMFSFNGVIPAEIRKLSNVHVHPGWVNDTLPTFLDANPIAPVGLVLIDLCVESSTAYVLDQIACRLNEGSIIVFANFFNFVHWNETSGERSAWLSRADTWGIQFEPIGFHATFMMIRITARPQKCPGSSSKIDKENEFDAVIHDWSTAKINEARRCIGRIEEDASFLKNATDILHEVIAVDPNNAEALGFLAFFLEDNNMISELFEYAHRALVIQHCMPAPGTDPVAMLTSLHKVPSFEPKFMRKLRKHRLRHDLEQFRYLLKNDRLPRNLTESAIGAYEEVLLQLSDVAETDMLTLSWSQWETIGPYFNRALYLPVVSRVRGGALNPAIDFTEVQEAYNSSDPQLVVVDDFLSKEALDKLVRYYREATIFYDVNHPSYLGSYMTDGLGNPVLAQVVMEVTQKLRPIICDRPLVQAWVYKYDDTKTQKGIDIHADSATVNFNIWLGEDAGLHHGRGGLVVFTAKAPPDWEFGSYNTSPLRPQAAQLLEESDYKNITVPYKQNRMIMFDSKLFHVSDVAGWKPGYEKRRINLTLLFGGAGSSCESSLIK